MARWDGYDRRAFLLAKIAAHIELNLFHRLTIESGREHLAYPGPLLIAANHTSFLDPIIISYIMQRPVYYLAWVRLFRHRMFAALIRKLGAIPLDSDRRTDKAAIAASLEVLRDGGALVVFPEGRRGIDSGLLPFESGIFRIALKAEAPILPIRIDGALKIWPRWKRFPRVFGNIRVNVKPPINPTDAKGETLRERVQSLKSLTYVALDSHQSAQGESGRQPGTVRGFR